MPIGHPPNGPRSRRAAAGLAGPALTIDPRAQWLRAAEQNLSLLKGGKVRGVVL